MHIYLWVTDMNFKHKLLNLSGFVLIFTLSVLLLYKPDICKNAVAGGIMLCGSVIIPSLFPYMVCMLYIINSDLTKKSQILTPITKRLFGLSQFPFLIMVFSFLGGYPIGGKLINDAVKNKALTQSQGRTMLNFCVNAGPAFIVTVVGSNVFHSEKIGYILLFSHILSSIIICVFSPKITAKNTDDTHNISIIDNFVFSASSAAANIISICGYVILFAVISAYLKHFSAFIPVLSQAACFLEITTAVTQVKNIYLISFLLGFSGICIWFQIFSVAKELKINIISFAASRLTHGGLSAAITFVLLKIFPTRLPTFSNTEAAPQISSIPKPALSVSLLILGIALIISLEHRENNRKILEDMI